MHNFDKLRSEDEIFASWSEEEIAVSICCMAFNHECFIEDTLKSFLNQETTFPYEVLIHDDASGDKTQSIIKAYAKKYPKIIKPIYQKENKYSKGIEPNITYNFPRAKGKYIAICEGDDYWTDKNKLQLQRDILANDTQISLCFHSGFSLDHQTKAQQKICRVQKQDSIIATKEIIKGGGSYMPTASLFFRASDTNILCKFFHDYKCPVSDFFFQIILSFEGKIFYIDKPMCVYRVNFGTSWTESFKKDTQIHVQFHKKMMRAILGLFNDFSHHPQKDYLSYQYVRHEYCSTKNLNLLTKIRKISFNWPVKSIKFNLLKYYFFLYLLLKATKKYLKRLISSHEK